MGQPFQGTVVWVDPAENWEVAGRPAGEQDLQSHLKAQHLETSPLRTNGRITSFPLQRQMDLETGEIQGIYSRSLVLRFCHPSWCSCSKHLTMVKWLLNIYRTGIFIGLLSWILHYLFLSVGKSCLTLCDSMHCNTPGFPVLHYFLEFAQTHVHWIGDAIQPSHPLPPPSPPAFNLSQHQGLFQCQFFASDGQSIGVSASAAVLPMNIQVVFLWDWLVWFACSPRDSQESSPAHTLKASILWHSVFFMVQLSHPYMTTGQTIALIIWAFVGKVMSLFFNTLSRLVIAFLPRSKHLLISWLQSLSVVILEPKYLLLVFVGVFGSFFFFFFNGGIVPFWKFTSVIQCWPF